MQPPPRARAQRPRKRTVSDRHAGGGTLGEIKIVGLCILAAVGYGIVHDQVTARVCVEYFTIGHPPVFHTESPTLLGLGWGIIATWWVGVLLGIPLALSAQMGTRPRRDARSLVRPIGMLLAVMAVSATLAGFVGYSLSLSGKIWLTEPLATLIPVERQALFLADLWTHLASYGVGFFGGLVVIALVWRSRGRMIAAPVSSPPGPEPEPGSGRTS